MHTIAGSVRMATSSERYFLRNGEFRIKINDILHWCRVAGAENRTAPIVVVHGGPGGNLYNFEQTIGPRLKEFSTIFYYEQRGSGRSEPPKEPDDYSIPTLVDDLEKICLDLGLEQIIPLGFSFGGELALEYTLAHPNRVKKLILQAPSIDDQKRIACTQLYGFKSVARGETRRKIQRCIEEKSTPEEQLEKVWEIANTETVDRFLFHNPEAARVNRRLWEESGLVNTGDMHRALLRQKRRLPDLLDRITSIDVPSLVLAGLYDRNVGLEICRDIYSQLQDAKLVIFNDSAHFPDIEETGKYSRVIREFLSTEGL